jgi:hypothetical protein
VILGVRFFLLLRRPRTPGWPRPRPSALALAAIILAGATLLGWLLFGGVGFLIHLAQGGSELRYYLDVNGMFFLGVPWLLALVFGVTAFRVGAGRRHNTVALIAVAVPVLLAVPTITSGVLYGLGLTD